MEFNFVAFNFSNSIAFDHWILNYKYRDVLALKN